MGQNGIIFPVSAGRQFYDQIVGNSDPVGLLRSLVNSNPPTFENQWLDFKGGQTPKGQIPESEIKKIWSKWLSGFSNTGGP